MRFLIFLISFAQGKPPDFSVAVFGKYEIVRFFSILILMTSEKPRFFRSKKELPRGAVQVDITGVSWEELFVIRNPRFGKTLFKHTAEWKQFLRGIQTRTIWVYWPAEHTVARMPDEELYFELRTARNKNLIMKDEQLAYRNAAVGIAGLSVGSSILSALVLTGGPKKIKIADFDTLASSNLNRMYANAYDVGSRKIDLAARRVWGIDPFAKLELWDKGLSEDNIERFMSGSPRLDIFIDEMDNIALKIKSRLICRKLGIPVLMATDNGDGVIVDVERFDLERKRLIFHGQIPAKEYHDSKMEGLKIMQMIIKIIDPAYFTERQQDSILNIGKTLAGVAQIGTAATMAGSAVAYVVRQIANKNNLLSGRYTIRCEEIFTKDYNSPKQKKRRAILTQKFTKTFGL